MLMCSDPVLSVPSQKQLKRIGRADLVIGIPTYRNAATVGMVAQTALDGVAADFADLRAVLINADGGSADDTCRAVADATADATVPVVVDSYTGSVGRGSAVRA